MDLFATIPQCLTGLDTRVNDGRLDVSASVSSEGSRTIFGKGPPMAEAPVLDKLTSILRDVFDSDELVATPELTAQKVEGWDSLGNVRLFLEIERVFSIRFSAVETTALKNVGELVAVIEKKTRR